MTSRLLTLSTIAILNLFTLTWLVLHSSHDTPPVFAVESFPPVTDSRFIAPERFRADVSAAAARYGVPQDIAIRLAYEESKWVEGLVCKNPNGTYDHNLFQTNSRYFTVKLTRAHIWEAMSHLSECYKAKGTWKGAILAWNSGITGSKHAPLSTIALAERVTGGNL